MTRTRHGHHVPGTTFDDEKLEMKIARCGGPGLCKECSQLAGRLHNSEYLRVEKEDVVKDEYVESPIMRFFQYDHLKSPQATVSQEFALLARRVDETLPAGPEKSTALRKLLEAKDAAVRASL